ncbi:hypothetical protein [Desulfitobacterium sp. AusDCA]|uniref:hypothetical protein n=1 Tax=Desulfitobacterium sp. AusDCA TaxID=3240383 RepID=UPI003DA7513C
MTNKRKADIYLTYLDQILAGEKDIGPVEDEEIAKLLLLAQSMIDADFSVNSQMKEKLKKQLLTKIAQFEDNFNGELKDEDLELVTAGGAGLTEKLNICPFCGSRLNKPYAKCPACNHS